MNRDHLQANWHASQKAFSDVSPGERESLLRQSVSDEITFTTPTSEGQSIGSLVEHIEEFQKVFPGASFQPRAFMSHHGELLATWALVAKDGAEIATGSTYARHNEQAVLTHIAAFMNP